MRLLKFFLAALLGTLIVRGCDHAKAQQPYPQCAECRRQAYQAYLDSLTPTASEPTSSAVCPCGCGMPGCNCASRRQQLTGCMDCNPNYPFPKGERLEATAPVSASGSHIVIKEFKASWHALRATRLEAKLQKQLNWRPKSAR